MLCGFSAVAAWKSSRDSCIAPCCRRMRPLMYSGYSLTPFDSWNCLSISRRQAAKSCRVYIVWITWFAWSRARP